MSGYSYFTSAHNVVWKLLVCSVSIGHVASQLYEGDSCPLTDSSLGVCQRLRTCDVIYQDLLSGKLPQSICSYVAFEPVVCCPLESSKTSSTTIRQSVPPSTWEPVTEDSDTSEPVEEIQPQRSLARQKCEQYAKSVYTQVYPPTLGINRTPVNISQCAIKSQKLIVGGTRAAPKEFPHMAGVGFNSSAGIVWLCGGTLISDRYVLTAAHCIYSLDFGKASWLRLGDLVLKREDDDAKVQLHKIARRIRHPEYNKPSEYHDIALLKTEELVTFNAWVRPACLPEQRQVDGLEKGIATGWGHMEWADDEGSDHLLKVTLPIIPHEKCSSIFGSSTDYQLKQGVIEEWQICAGEEGKDTCQGDSGGPLAIYDDQYNCMYDVVGITSIGRICGSISPGIYTRVYHYIPWLESIVWAEQ